MGDTGCTDCTDKQYCDACWDALPYVQGRKYDAALMEQRRLRAEAANRLANLAACLREAAGLTKAWRLGTNWPYYLDDEEDDEYLNQFDTGRTWRPGCGRAAPGWTVK